MNRAVLTVIFTTVAATATAQSMTSIGRVAHEYVPEASLSSGQVVVPSNLHVSSVYRALVDKMISRSSTFRRQLGRIAGARQLTVHLGPNRQPGLHGVRARTHFVRQGDGTMLATIDIEPLQDNVELIAHELEHVIEQLDDVDLVVKATRPNSGVRRVVGFDALFETTRAARTGLQVAHEVR